MILAGVAEMDVGGVGKTNIGGGRRQRETVDMAMMHFIDFPVYPFYWYDAIFFVFSFKKIK